MDREKIIKGLECCIRWDKLHCGDCPMEGPGFGLACRDSLMRYAHALLKALNEPRVLRPEEYDTWTGDAWAEDFDPGVVTAIDRSAVKAYGKYVRFDRDGAKRLWTGRPSEERRKAVPWE